MPTACTREDTPQLNTAVILLKYPTSDSYDSTRADVLCLNVLCSPSRAMGGGWQPHDGFSESSGADGRGPGCRGCRKIFERSDVSDTVNTRELWVWINYQITESHISVNAYMKKRNYFPPEKYLSPYQTFMPKKANVMKWSEVRDLSFVFFIHFWGRLTHPNKSFCLPLWRN